MADMGVAFQTNEIGSYFMLSYLEYAVLRFLGRFECNLGNNFFSGRV